MEFKALKTLTVKDNGNLVTIQKDEVVTLSDKFTANPFLEVVKKQEEKKPATKKVVTNKTTKKK